MFNADDFFDAVKAMRRKQKRFYKDRSRDNLNAAKGAEQVVDRMIEDGTGQLTFLPVAQVEAE